MALFKVKQVRDFLIIVLRQPPIHLDQMAGETVFSYFPAKRGIGFGVCQPPLEENDLAAIPGYSGLESYFITAFCYRNTLIIKKSIFRQGPGLISSPLPYKENGNQAKPYDPEYITFPDFHPIT